LELDEGLLDDFEADKIDSVDVLLIHLVGEGLQSQIQVDVLLAGALGGEHELVQELLDQLHLVLRDLGDRIVRVIIIILVGTSHQHLLDPCQFPVLIHILELDPLHQLLQEAFPVHVLHVLPPDAVGGSVLVHRTPFLAGRAVLRPSLYDQLQTHRVLIFLLLFVLVEDIVYLLFFLLALLVLLSAHEEVHDTLHDVHHLIVDDDLVLLEVFLFLLLQCIFLLLVVAQDLAHVEDILEDGVGEVEGPNDEPEDLQGDERDDSGQLGDIVDNSEVDEGGKDQLVEEEEEDEESVLHPEDELCEHAGADLHEGGLDHEWQQEEREGVQWGWMDHQLRVPIRILHGYRVLLNEFIFALFVLKLSFIEHDLVD